MKAVGFKKSLPINDEQSFIDFTTTRPTPGGHDLLIEVHAVSVNPVDFKIRQSAATDEDLPEPKIIGWDAAGTVVAVGDKTSLFRVGDEVYYAGDLTRPGSNAEFQLVDERIVGRKPKSLTNAQAAAMPLTVLTAYETLFDRIRVDPKKDAGKSILILAGAGGVGSVAIQLAKKLGNLTVIATASREESRQWCEKMGADFVVNHHNLKAELQKIGHEEIDYILDFVDLEGYWDLMTELVKPQGHLVSITNSGSPLDLMPLKTKSVSFHWEFMYTRSMYATHDIARQHEILNHVADLLDSGQLQHTLTTTLKGLSADSLRKAHKLQESGKTIGKTVIDF